MPSASSPLKSHGVEIQTESSMRKTCRKLWLLAGTSLAASQGRRRRPSLRRTLSGGMVTSRPSMPKVTAFVSGVCGSCVDQHSRQGLPHLLGARQTASARHRRVAAHSAGEKHRHAARGLLDRPLPASRVIGAEFHHVARENGCVGPVNPQHRELAGVLLHHGIAEFGVHLPQPAHQTVPDELRRREVAMPKPRPA